MQKFHLDDRIAFVSGGAGHLGSAMTRALAEAGAHVIVNGRNEARLRDLVGELKGQGYSAESACFDVADFPQVRSFFSGLKQLDILINNAVSMTPAPRDALTPESFDETYRSSVTAAFEAARAALPALRNAAETAGDASIVNIASMYATVSPDQRLYSDPRQASPLHYGPAKAGLLQLTRHLASEFGRSGIRVNAIVPGPFPRAEVASKDPQFASRLAERTMLGRTGAAHEIAGPLLFLASTASSFVTGSSLVVDGGWTAW